MLYHFLDIFFLTFHLALVVFVMSGWIWRKTRPWNLAAIVLVLASWFLLGLKYGLGYCPLTDWHWRVLHKLGEYQLPTSYVSYLIFRVTGWMPNQNAVDIITLLATIASFIVSAYLNIRDFIKKKKQINTR